MVSGMRMYSNLSNGVPRSKVFDINAHSFASCVLNTLFHNIFDVVRSAVCVVSSPGYLVRFPLTVMHIQLGSGFCGW